MISEQIADESCQHLIVAINTGNNYKNSTLCWQLQNVIFIFNRVGGWGCSHHHSMHRV